MLLISDLLEQLGELVGAGGTLAATVDALQALDGVGNLHTLEERGKTLGVATAAAYEGHVFDDTIAECNINLHGADTLRDGRNEETAIGSACECYLW